MVIYTLLLLILIKLIIRFCINESFISEYNNGQYDEGKIQKLLILNIEEPYIAHYNYGNLLYKNADFYGAISEYNKALALFPAKEKECSIRINLALAMLKNINEEEVSEDNTKNTLEILKNAREVLCENGCANRNDDNGHSAEAEKLKKDIDKKIQELMRTRSRRK